MGQEMRKKEAKLHKQREKEEKESSKKAARLEKQNQKEDEESQSKPFAGQEQPQTQSQAMKTQTTTHQIQFAPKNPVTNGVRQTENVENIPCNNNENDQDFQNTNSDNDPVTVSVMFSYPVLKTKASEEKKKKSSREQNKDQFARFVEQELKNHQALEQECDTLKRKKKMKENELQKLADRELK